MIKIISVKTINQITAWMLLMFFLSISFFSIQTIHFYYQDIAAYEQLLNEVNTFNTVYSQDTTQINEGQDNNGLPSGFSNATDAFLQAYNKVFNESESYYVVSRGTMTSQFKVAVTITVLTESKNTMIKFKNGSLIIEVTSYEEGNDFQGIVSTMLYYDAVNYKLYHNKTTNVQKTKDDLIATYNENDWTVSSGNRFYELMGFYPGQPIYQFTKKGIRREISFLKTNINAISQLEQYALQIESNPFFVAQNYRSLLKFIIKSPSLPIMHYMYQSAIVDKEGNFKKLIWENNFNAEVKILSNLVINGNCTEKLEYDFVQLGGDINYKMPNIELAREGNIS